MGILKEKKEKKTIPGTSIKKKFKKTKTNKKNPLLMKLISKFRRF